MSSSASTRRERVGTIVIGAGQAGLATGYHLARRDADFVLLEAGARVGDAWRQRWDSLRLFTPAGYSGLPGRVFPAPPAHLPDKDEVADYLERYAEWAELPVRLGARVERVTREGGRFVVRSAGGTYEGESVVVATGAFHRPRLPAVAAALGPGIHQLHSSAYRNPFALPDGPVLVVGAGNSGAQLALELARHRKVWLSGRDTGRLPRRLLGRDVYDWLWPVLARLTTDTAIGRRLRAASHRGDPVIGMPRGALAEAGVVRVGRLESARGGLPVCGDEVLQPRVVVWCTGFAPDFSWLALPVLDDAGRPRHARGVATDVEGLFFVGLRFQHRVLSSLLGGVGDDAAYVAERAARRGELRMAA